jgi:N-methylhydantoinase B
VIELRYPLRCERFELRPEVAGPGRFRGGAGIRRDYRALEPGIYLQTANENTLDVLARGAHGGGDGEPSAVVLWPETDRERTLPERVSRFGPLEVGDVISLRTGGGGGWGSPFERDPNAVLEDVRDEKLTDADALAQYGVVLTRQADGAWTLDARATDARRGSST